MGGGGGREVEAGKGGGEGRERVEEERRALREVLIVCGWGVGSGRGNNFLFKDGKMKRRRGLGSLDISCGGFCGIK